MNTPTERFPSYKPIRVYTREGELVALKRNLKRASLVGLPATLTIEQWMKTLEDFEYACSYCKAKEYQVLEHFVPLGLGGGTTVTNCLPSCRSCNVTKSEWHPFDLPIHFFVACRPMHHIHEIAPSLKEYLDLRGNEDL